MDKGLLIFFGLSVCLSFISFFYGFGYTSIEQYFSLTNVILANFYKNKKKDVSILFETIHSLEEN